MSKLAHTVALKINKSLLCGHKMNNARMQVYEMASWLLVYRCDNIQATNKYSRTNNFGCHSLHIHLLRVHRSMDLWTCKRCVCVFCVFNICTRFANTWHCLHFARNQTHTSIRCVWYLLILSQRHVWSETPRVKLWHSIGEEKGIVCHV